MENTIEVYDGMIFGFKVSDYGLEKGYLDYGTLAKMVGDMIINNTIRDKTLCDWEIVNGEFTDMIFSDYIISDRGYEIIKQYTNELVFYNENLDIYIWAVDHWGTAWSHVLTNVKLKEIKDGE